MFRATSSPIIRSSLLYIRALESFMQVFDDRFQVQSGWNCSYILTASGWLFKKKRTSRYSVTSSSIQPWHYPNYKHTALSLLEPARTTNE